MYTLLFSSQRRLWPSLGPQRLEPLEAQAEARGAPEAGAGPSSPPRLGKASSLAPCHGAPLATWNPFELPPFDFF